MRQTILLPLIILFFLTTAFGQNTESESYLAWSASQAEAVGKSMRKSGQIGSSFDLRGIHTNRSINYKLRATWMTPEVIRASARLQQLKYRLTDKQTRELVAEAEAAGETVFMVEIDPREGSGVIPMDWRAILQPKGLSVGSEGAVAGDKSPTFQNIKALAGTARRDYDWDVFWVTFPLVDKNRRSVFLGVAQLELIIGIYNSEGRLAWEVPESIRTKIKLLSKK